MAYDTSALVTTNDTSRCEAPTQPQTTTFCPIRDFPPSAACAETTTQKNSTKRRSHWKPMLLGSLIERSHGRKMFTWWDEFYLSFTQKNTSMQFHLVANPPWCHSKKHIFAFYFPHFEVQGVSYNFPVTNDKSPWKKWSRIPKGNEYSNHPFSGVSWQFQGG